MRKFIFLSVLCLGGLSLFSQTSIRLRNAALRAEDNITEIFISKYNSEAKKAAGMSWSVFYFKQRPSVAELSALRQEGIELLQYIPGNLYTASISKPLRLQTLKNAGIRSIIELKPLHKIEPALYATTGIETEVMVRLFQNMAVETAIESLIQAGASITNTSYAHHNILQIKIPAGKLLAIAELPFIEYIEPPAPQPTELNFNGRNSSKTNVVQSTLPGHPGLNGEGVIIGVGEISTAQAHIDFKNRFRNYAGGAGGTYHGTHVLGIIGGAGLVNELYTGYAPKSKLLLTSASGFINGDNFSTFNLGIVLTNNSYASGSQCSPVIYSMFHHIADKAMRDNERLQHVFSAGNSGETTCTNYPAGFNTVLSQYHSAKNVLTVGSASHTGDIAFYSSRGPAGGGRLKPEIVASGTSIWSTTPDNGYGGNTGTSMSGPAVVGGMALLYQHYRRLHDGNNPRSGLLKAIICNSATDRGNPGPDFMYGFGYMNMLRAVNTITQNNYIIDSIADHAEKTYNINVPVGTAQLKVMLYWHDAPASLLSSKALVNDLDIQVITPTSATVLPYVLDTLPANVGNAATRGEDHINNIEQVVIDNPVAGTYTIKIRGTEIGQDVYQEFVVVYDKVEDNVYMTFPTGGEGLVPGETVTVQWDSWGQNGATFHLQYSPDNGSNWQTIDAAIAANKRQYNWTVPSTATNMALMRITRSGDIPKTSTSAPFVVVGAPTISLNAVQCPDQIAVDWSAVSGATDYQLMMVKNGEMIVVDSTTATSYIFRNLSPDSVYWVSVRSRIGQKYGRRAIAISRQPNTGTCAGTAYDNDIKAEALLTPLFGRKFTSTSLSTNQPIVARIRNMDDQALNGYSVQYSINNSAWVTENPPVSIAAANYYDHSFTTTYDLSAPGNYLIRIVVNKNGDVNRGNDTISYVIKNLDNQPVDITAFRENFEQAELATYMQSHRGLAGIDRFDYLQTGGWGYIEVLPSAVTDTSGRGLKLWQPNDGGHEIIATFNLSAYNTATHNVGLEFLYRKITQLNSLSDRVSIRGSDTDPWIEVMDMNSSTEQFTTRVANFTTAGLLNAASQNYSSSFQVKWTHQQSAVDYAIDNIKLFNAAHNVELVSIDSLPVKGCNITSTVPVRITVVNHSVTALTNLPVMYRIDGGSIQHGLIASIGANDTVRYTFPIAADISTRGKHVIEAWTALASDNYPANDKRTVTIHNQPTISTFPYLENFENGDGNWYGEGTNNSWEYGTPASQLIREAASGTKAWKTKLAGRYNDWETSFLYSPCFDLSGISKPVMSISVALNLDSCNLACDFVTFQYSTNGKDWRNGVLNARPGFNWPAAFRSSNYSYWHVATTSLSDTMGVVQFRFQLRTNFNIGRDGIAIDDIHIYDSTTAIYDEASSSPVIEQTLSGGNQWIDFKHNGKIIASIQPNGQNLGLTGIRNLLHTTPSHFHGQYHVNRNFTITSANAPVDSIGVRLYILDDETDAMLFDQGCADCMKPVNAYRLGISEYRSPKPTELNSSVSDNIEGAWRFIPYSRIKTVPFQKGYYLEFKTKDLSEYWMNNGGYDDNSILPTLPINFTATLLAGNEVKKEWSTASEININRFEIELAKGNAAYQTGNFTNLATVNSQGPSPSQQSYQYSDASGNKQGVYYYRIKVIDDFGKFAYSKAVAVVFSNEYDWTITPNLSTGLYYLNYQANAGEKVNMEIYDAGGSLVHSAQFNGNGFIRQQEIDLRNTKYAGGFYLVRVYSRDFKEVFKIIKQ